jgi:hypothetical protein
MTVSPDDLRPRWWTIIVVILDILLPSIMVTGFFLIPETMFLEEYIQDPLLSTMFRYIARSNASGDALVILICCFEVTTKDLAILKVCNTFLLFFFALGNLCSLYVILTYKQSVDPIGDTVDFVDLLLQLFLYWNIRNKLCPRNVGEEASSETSPLNV